MFNPESFASQIEFSPPPKTWGDYAYGEFSRLHQISPYIGKLQPRIARALILQHTRSGETVVDPFCGSGTIPLEAVLAGRRVVAGDTSPYAYLLTRAKLSPPSTAEEARANFERINAACAVRKPVALEEVPAWVRQFFHPQTLVEVVRFADECIERKNYFLLACLLGILHHQRPGFLSYPSSHLVPYLRDKKFPRSDFPDLYEYRDLVPRMLAKIERAFKVSHAACSDPSFVVRRATIEHLSIPTGVDAIITSPPYMNALDYRRDNRLRLWFLDRSVQNYDPEPTDKQKGLSAIVAGLVRQARTSLRVGGRLVLVIGETVLRKRIQSHPSVSYSLALEKTGQFVLVDAIRDHIPDIRRSRREYRATKAEHVLVYERVAS